MAIRNLIAAISLSASILAPPAALASPANRPPCMLNEYRVSAVKPYRVVDRFGKIKVERLRGAQIYVVAEPGLTREWLQLKLQRHVRAMQSATMGDCAFDLDGVRVATDSAGGGFWVTLTTKDSDTAKELLRRARLQVGS